MSSKRVRIGDDQGTSSEQTPLMKGGEEYGADENLKSTERFELQAAERLSMRLLAIPDDDEEEEDRILFDALDLKIGPTPMDIAKEADEKKTAAEAKDSLITMIVVSVVALGLMGAALYLGVEFVGPPSQPVGPYQLVELQEGEAFFDYYNFYEGKDSVGSNGYNTYVGMDRAKKVGIVNVTREEQVIDVFARRRLAKDPAIKTKSESFIYMGSSPTKAGPRESIRLEGKRRFNRGLFIIDLRHMPAGCGVWPAFWLTDEPNWPINGEIDIVEGVNYQDVAKTALHTTQGCLMDDIPGGVSTGGWDESVGIPDRKTGIPDMTMRYAQDCFVYDPHQWLNQGCVAVDKAGGTLGIPLNEKGGGVYALEWDPVNKRMRTWVFTPHESVPDNLRDAINTADLTEEQGQVLPDPDFWPLPYGYFAIGEGTSCPAEHFKNMHLVFNLAFCGSVSGNRYWLDCPKQAKDFNTCNDYVKSEPDEINEAYWKIHGVYVYERSWERTWLN